MSPKERAAAAALTYVRSGMVLGLGTGSTADCLLVLLAAKLRQGALRDIRGVPTSQRSHDRAIQLGIPLAMLAECPHPDLTIDGADEITSNLDLIKGLGGALVREKIVAQNSHRLIIIADSSKTVAFLGQRSPLPVEVVPFAHESHRDFFQTLGASPQLRRTPEGSTYITDNGNYIYDCRFSGIDRPKELEEAMLHRAGVVDCGLFLGMAELAIVADDRGVSEIKPRP